MSWRYRVMQHESDGTEPPYLAIHEVYDDPSGWTTDPVHVGALTEPVLDHETGREVTG